MEKLVENYVERITSTNEYKKLIELKKIINQKYKMQIIAFKNKEALYLEAKKNKEYYNDFELIKKSFIDAKKNLYSKEEVKEYFTYERLIQNMLDEDMNDLKRSISDSFFINSNCQKNL